MEVKRLPTYFGMLAALHADFAYPTKRTIAYQIMARYPPVLVMILDTCEELLHAEEK